MVTPGETVPWQMRAQGTKELMRPNQGEERWGGCWRQKGTTRNNWPPGCAWSARGVSEKKTGNNRQMNVRGHRADERGAEKRMRKGLGAGRWGRHMTTAEQMCYFVKGGRQAAGREAGETGIHVYWPAHSSKPPLEFGSELE
jgi:hypothetical protein